MVAGRAVRTTTGNPNVMFTFTPIGSPPPNPSSGPPPPTRSSPESAIQTNIKRLVDNNAK